MNGKIFTGLTPFSPMLPFYAPWKHQEISGFLKFSGGTESSHGLTCSSDVLTENSEQILEFASLPLILTLNIYAKFTFEIFLSSHCSCLWDEHFVLILNCMIFKGSVTCESYSKLSTSFV